MWELWGVEILAFPLTWHIAYTTACCCRTSRDGRIILFVCIWVTAYVLVFFFLVYCLFCVACLSYWRINILIKIQATSTINIIFVVSAIDKIDIHVHTLCCMFYLFLKQHAIWNYVLRWSTDANYCKVGYDKRRLASWQYVQTHFRQRRQLARAHAYIPTRAVV